MGSNLKRARICLSPVSFALVFYVTKMSLWVDKYRPTALHKLDYHKELAIHLKKLVSGITCIPTNNLFSRYLIMYLHTTLINPMAKTKNTQQSSFMFISSEKIVHLNLEDQHPLAIHPPPPPPPPPLTTTISISTV